jgi:hypothetical protein
VRFVVDSDLECAVPLVHLDVKFDSAVVKSSRQQNLFSFRYLFLINSKRSVPCRFTWQLFHVVNELDFISLIDCGKCNFDRIIVELSSLWKIAIAAKVAQSVCSLTKRHSLIAFSKSALSTCSYRTLG